MIEKIITLTNRDKMEMTVFYEKKTNGTRQKKRYRETDNLPMTVVMFLLNAKYSVEYRDYGKFETYAK